MQTKFLQAVENNDIDTVKELIKVVNPSMLCNYAIKLTICKGYIEMFQLLLSDERTILDEYTFNTIFQKQIQL